MDDPPCFEDDRDGDVHVMPNYGREHRCSCACWCMPERDYEAENGHQVWVHREMN